MTFASSTPCWAAMPLSVSPARTMCSRALRACDDADVLGREPVFSAGERVGFVTSGTYGHHVKQSLALAYVDSACLTRGANDLSVAIIGKPQPARWLHELPYDPQGSRLRA
jgi:dimethylglycine dehydrogenase